MPRTGQIWNYFNNVDYVAKKAECKYCNKCLSFKTTITNLKIHFKQKHIIVYEEMCNIARNTNPNDIVTEYLVEDPVDIDQPLKNTPSNSRVEILRKKKEAALSSLREKNKPNKTSVNDSFRQLSVAKLELVELQKKSIEIEIIHKKKIQEIEMLELQNKIKHSEAIREKELILIDIKIKNEMSK